MIKVSMTYSETTPESCEEEDFSDTGFLWEDEEMTFRELVRLLRDHRESSCSPAGGDVFEWYSSGYSTTCYTTGTERETSIHYSRQNKPHKEKYWKKAATIAGIIKAQPAKLAQLKETK